MGSYCLMGVALQFEMMETVVRVDGVMVAQPGKCTWYHRTLDLNMVKIVDLML